MRIAEFYVPQGCVCGFAQELGEHGFDNRITGITDDNEIIVQVQYDKDESDEIDELEAALNNLIRELEEEYEDEDEDEDDDED